jgi:hypothetical protein
MASSVRLHPQRTRSAVIATVSSVCAFSSGNRRIASIAVEQSR